MIILKDEENAIVNLFDTAKEFKDYIFESLSAMEEEMIKDGEGTIFVTDIMQQSFCCQLEMYLEMTCETVEIK